MNNFGFGLHKLFFSKMDNLLINRLIDLNYK